MLKVLREALRSGTATVAYPFGPAKKIPDTRGKPVHVNALCVACGACATACPPNAIQMQIDGENKDKFTWSIDYGRCIFCGRCEEVCPTYSMYLSDEFELAAFNRTDLLSDATYDLVRCSSCGEPFAPRKKIDYVMRLLASGYDADDPELLSMSEWMHMCPECRSLKDAANMPQRHLRRVDEPEPISSQETGA